MTQIKKSYDEWDFPLFDATPISQREIPQEKSKTKKIRTIKPLKTDPIVVDPNRPSDFLIKKLVGGLRKNLPEVDIKDPKQKYKDNEPLGIYVSYIFYENDRIGYLFQNIGGERVFLHFDKSSNIAIWSDGLDIRKVAKIIRNEIDKNYERKIAAKLSTRDKGHDIYK